MPKEEEYSPYAKVLGDLKLLMKRKMIDKKIKGKSKTKDVEPEEEEEKKKTPEVVSEESEMDEGYVSDYMKSKRDKKKELGGSLMVSLGSKKPPAPKKKGKKRA